MDKLPEGYKVAGYLYGFKFIDEKGQEFQQIITAYTPKKEGKQNG